MKINCPDQFRTLIMRLSSSELIPDRSSIGRLAKVGHGHAFARPKAGSCTSNLGGL